MVDTPELLQDEITRQALKQTVQRQPEVSKDGIVNTMALAGWRGSILPARGDRRRLFAQRDYYFMDEQSVGRGAISGVSKHGASLPWEITGDNASNPMFREMGQELGFTISSGVEYFQTVLRQSNFGAGWGQLMTQSWADILRYDTGVFIEVIGAGNSWEALTGAITGLAHLDPLRCVPTGDPRYPCIYYDRWGGIHVMHYTRVIMIQDMNDGDDYRPGWGDSAWGRAISVAVREMWMVRYAQAYLDDEAPPGLDIFGGITKGMFDEVERQFKNQQTMDSKPIWGKRMRLFTAGAQFTPEVKSVQWQTAPEKFDYRVYTDINVDIMALALGVDRQELMQLSGGGAIGSEGQSIILHQKSKGKTIGFIITELERRFNDILPDGYEFSFKTRDEQEAKSQADKAAVWGGFIQQTKHLLDAREQRNILTAQVEAVQDALDNQTRVNDVDITPEASANDTGDEVDNTTEALPLVNGTIEMYRGLLTDGSISLGKYQRLIGQAVTPGWDKLYMYQGLPTPEEEVPNLWKYKQTVAPSVYNSELITGEPLPQPVDPTQVIPDGEPGNIEAEPLDENAPAPETKPVPAAFKSYESTEADFIENVRDLLKSAVEGDGFQDKRAFSVSLRSILKRYGLLAFKDGMRQGGVAVTDLDPEDQEFYQEAFLYQAGFIPSFANEVFTKGVTPAAIDTLPACLIGEHRIVKV